LKICAAMAAASFSLMTFGYYLDVWTCPDFVLQGAPFCGGEPD
jgi:hypothetical protein